ncbi:carbon storage regulator [Uliginosibacterium sp. 31-12]|uniref:carbon storage regulator n=1 Tax=Uliginosibacterium sp. 31-12 TaxID=3062781 RepID=UPI0026E34F38|nr:carbon storage regulator [Uliginosibacterium sp. 31-12]MDO6385586.1 carbon storage regulator [Uliginosibacterium sp. 31-12]
MTERETSCLTLDVKAGESVKLAGGLITIEVCEKSGRTARLRVHAPRDVAIEKSSNSDEGDGPALAPCMS